MFSQCSSLLKFPTSFSGVELPEFLCRLKEQWRVMPSTTHPPENTAALAISKQWIATTSVIMQTAEYKHHNGRDWRGMAV